VEAGVGRGALRVAIYARVSTGEQSPELQLRELRDYAGRRGFAVRREYVDRASGDVRHRKRAPEFDALMAACCMDLADGAGGQVGVGTLAFPLNSGRAVALQAEPGPPPAHTSAETQGHQLGGL